MKHMLICLAVMLFLTFGVCAEVVGGSCGENASWSLDTDTGVFSVSGSGFMKGYSPSGTESDITPWRDYKPYIKSVVIENGIRNISAFAFIDCSNLSEVVIADGVETIDKCAFSHCSALTSVVMPDSLTAIYDHAFIYCTNLSELRLGKNIQLIKYLAFYGCKALTTVNVPDSTKTIAADAFGNIDGLTLCGSNTSYAKVYAIENGIDYNVTDGSSDITVYVDGKCLDFDVKPYIKNGRTMVPFRTIFEAISAEVEWVEETQTVNALWDEIPLSLTIGNNVMIRKNKEFILDVQPEIVDGRTMVPVRAISEAFRCKVSWHEPTSTVIIKTENYEYTLDEDWLKNRFAPIDAITLQ